MPATTQKPSRRSLRLLRAQRELQRTELVDHENTVLLPVLTGQLKYILSCFERIKEIAANPQTAQQISFPLSQVIPVHQGDPDAAAAQYLGTVVSQCETDFILPIRSHLTAAEGIHDVKSLGGWLGIVQSFCSTVARNRDILFWGKHQAFISVRTPTGEILSGPPQQLESIVFPFNTILAEIGRVASAIDTSVDNWVTNQRDWAKRLLETATTEHQESIVRWTSWAQIAATGGSLVLVLAGVFIGDWYSRKLHAEELRIEVQDLQRERAANEQTIVDLRKRLEAPPVPPPQ